MPELPEVETIVRQIKPLYLGKTITHIKANPVRIFKNTSAKDFASALINKKLCSIRRYGKFLIWQVGDVHPVFHLGMSGIFIRNKSNSLYPQHIHITFKFEDGSYLYFQDVRKFSKVFLYNYNPKFENLGLDPTNKNFTLIKFKKLLHLSGITIKSFLMDQHRIAGIGNIYANESLFEAEINPFKPANKLSDKEENRLYSSIKMILEQAIKHFGTTYTSYRTVEGKVGENRDLLKVYHKVGKPCPRCGNVISKTIINSRSTFFCKACQK